MRILMVEPGPDFSVQDVHNGWLAAFGELGITVASLNLNDRLDFYSQVALKRKGRWQRALSTNAAIRLASKGLLAAVYEFAPDVVLITSCFFVPPDVLDLLRARGAKVVVLFTESPYEDDIQLARAARADVAVINDPTNLDDFQKVCPIAYYQPHAYSAALHAPAPPKAEFKSDVVFVGTAFHDRITFLEAIDWSGIDLFLGGNWMRLALDSPLAPFLAHARGECMDNEQTVAAYTSTKASFNIYRTEGEIGAKPGWACGPREIELAATGCWFARQTRPESDELFPMLPTFETPDELSVLLRWALDHEPERREAAAQARAAIADRSFLNSAKRLLQLLAK